MVFNTSTNFLLTFNESKVVLGTYTCENYLDTCIFTKSVNLARFHHQKFLSRYHMVQIFFITLTPPPQKKLPFAVQVKFNLNSNSKTAVYLFLVLL